MYEYVPKSEYGPARREWEKILNKVQHEMRDKNDLPFQFKLIGSGKRHLVTRVKNGNEGFDFDYNLIICPPGEGYDYRADVIKQQFMTAFNNAVKGTKYSCSKDSTSAITIKVIDRQKKKVVYSCDFAVIYYDENSTDDGYYFLRNNKNQNRYEFAFRKLKFNIDKRVDEIIEENGWNYIREEYLKLKNTNTVVDKHSFSLYVEAVNNVYNWMFLQE